MSKPLALLAVVVCCSADSLAQPKPPAPAKPIVVHAAHMFDGVSKQLQGPVTVTLLNGRIISVQPDTIAVPGADVIDLGDDTLLPGLIDAHKHMGGAPQTGSMSSRHDSPFPRSKPRSSRPQTPATC